MIVATITASVILLVSNIVLYRMFTSERKLSEEYNGRIVELERKNEAQFHELNKDRDIYASERKSILSENEMYKVINADLEKTLGEYTKDYRAYQAEMDNLNNFAREMTVDEFLQIREKVNKGIDGLYDYTGIYVLENKTHDKYYVGQSISLFRRVGAHFTGSGNKDIFEDYSRGDEWTIKLIALSDSGFKSINALEKHFIEYHHSTYNGYNKTVGNAN